MCIRDRSQSVSPTSCSTLSRSPSSTTTSGWSKKAILQGLVISLFSGFDVSQNKAKRQVDVEGISLGVEDIPQHVRDVTTRLQPPSMHQDALSSLLVCTNLRPTVAAAKSELLSRTDGPMKERHHQTLSVTSSRVSLSCLFGKSVGGILHTSSQPYKKLYFPLQR